MGIPFEGKKRFRVNPIEVAIFSVITLIFVKSGYSLLYSHDGLDPATLSNIAGDIDAGQSRAPASVTKTPVKTFSEVTIGCDPANENPSVSSKKIRLIGTLCTDTQDETAQDVKKISVVNTSAKVAATVFTDYSNQKFSTDYMSLAPGKNTIYVEYEFKDGKIFGREYSVTKN